MAHRGTKLAGLGLTCAKYEFSIKKLLQLDVLFTQKVIGDEDCLVVNIYVPGDAAKERKEDELLPVMFWIHGGGFFLGSGNTDLFGPDRLMDYGVVRHPHHFNGGLF